MGHSRILHHQVGEASHKGLLPLSTGNDLHLTLPMLCVKNPYIWDSKLCSTLV